MTIKNLFNVAQLGSNWNNGTNCGLYWNLNNGVGNRNRNISAQLEYGMTSGMCK